MLGNATCGQTRCILYGLSSNKLIIDPSCPFRHLHQISIQGPKLAFHLHRPVPTSSSFLPSFPFCLHLAYLLVSLAQQPSLPPISALPALRVKRRQTPPRQHPLANPPPDSLFSRPLASIVDLSMLKQTCEIRVEDAHPMQRTAKFRANTYDPSKNRLIVPRQVRPTTSFL